MSRWIITHPGTAHFDEFLACCLILAKDDSATIILRREPSAEELANPNVYVVDVGRRHEPELLNFDHHQLSDAVCAFTLVEQHFSVFDPLDKPPWYEFRETLDSRGPNVALALAGISREAWDMVGSPLENCLLEMFSGMGGFSNSNDCGRGFLFSLMRQIGEMIVGRATEFRKRMTALHDQSRIRAVGDIRCLDIRFVPANERPAFACEAFCQRFCNEVVVTISNDDRGPGYSLYRRNDNPRIDFRQIAGDESVSFVHQNGFVAKTREKISDKKLDSLISRATLEVS